MRILLFIFLFISSVASAQLTVNAGSDKTIPRRPQPNSDTVMSQVRLIATISGGTAPYTIVWRCITSVSNTTIANIIDPTNDTTDVIILPYKSGGYNFEISVTDAAAANKKDTVNVSVNWGTLPPQRTTLRKANATDTTNINAVDGVGYCKINDIIIDGANDGENIGGNKTDIYVASWSGIGPLVGGQNILIKASQNYGNIQIYFSDAGTDIDTTTFAGYDAKGIPTNPITIKPYGGQVRSHHFGIKNGVGVVINGFTLPAYQGHLNGNYAFSAGKYGFWFDNGWTNIAGHNMGAEGNFGCRRMEIKGVEAGNGQFSGLFVKENGSARNWDHFYIHDNYFHDTHGEILYKGSTAGDPQPSHSYATIENNRFIRGGNEGIQFGQQNTGNVVRNNIVINAANNWRSCFQADQMFGHQIGWRNGGNFWTKNIVDGSSEQFISIFQYAETGLASNSLPNRLSNSLYINSKSWIGAFVGGSGVSGVQINFDSLYIGKFFYEGTKVFTSHANTQEIIRGQNAYLISLRNSFRDGTKTTWISNNTGSNLDTANNNVLSSIPVPQYNNTGFPTGFNFSHIERWADTTWWTFHDEYAGQGEKQYDPIVYSIGDTVTHMSRIYVSKVNNNHKRPPQGKTDDWWTLLTWTDGVTTYYYPPDDFRLPTTDPYAQRGIGLLDQVSTAPFPGFKRTQPGRRVKSIYQ